MPSINDILAFVGSVFAILIVLPMHEFAHAFAAVKCGDETPRVYSLTFSACSSTGRQGGLRFPSNGSGG